MAVVEKGQHSHHPPPRTFLLRTTFFCALWVGTCPHTSPFTRQHSKTHILRIPKLFDHRTKMSGTGAAVCNGTALPTSTAFQIAAERPFCGYVGSSPSSSGASAIQSCCAGPVLNGSQYDASEAGAAAPRKYEGCIVYCQVAEKFARRPTEWQRCVEPLLPPSSAGDQWTCDVGRNVSISGAIVNGSESNNGANTGSSNGAGSDSKITVSKMLLPLVLMSLLALQLVLPAAAATR